MDLLIEFIEETFWFVKESAVYILFGILVAGYLRFAVSQSRFDRFFGRDDLKSVTSASLFGIPLPLCSCAVLPMMISLRKRGASKGATVSFLISTPETGVDSISVTYALLDPIFTVARPIAALISAVVTGTIVNVFVRRGWDKDEAPKEGPEEEEAYLNQHEKDMGESTHRRAFRYGMGTLMDDLTPLLLIAFLGSGLIAIIVPDSFFDNPVTRGWPGMFLMLVVGIPFYVCATSSTPIVAALLLKGLSPGAALVFLLAGPVTNLGTIAAVLKHLGRRIMFVYLFSMAGLTLIMGGIIESIYRDMAIPVEAIVGKAAEIVPEPIKIAAVILLILSMVASAKRTDLFRKWGDKLRSLCRPLRLDPLGKRAQGVYLAALLLVYLSTCFSVLDVGETGWMLTFGQVERDASGQVITRTEPGLVMHFPYPFQTFRSEKAEEIRMMDFGHRRRDGTDVPEEVNLDLDAQVMNGDESLVSLKFTIHYWLADPFAYYFLFDDPDELIESYAAAAVRTVCARQSTQDILVYHRPALEEESRYILQSELDRLGCGVGILDVYFVDVHAPPEVHYAFRDVASAGEDKHKSELKGESNYIRIMAQALGSTHRIREEAENYGHAERNKAMGRAQAFRQRAAAYEESRDLTRLRMLLDTMNDVLEAARTVMPLDAGIDVELWLKGEKKTELPFLEDAQEETGAEKPPAPKEGRPEWVDRIGARRR